MTVSFPDQQQTKGKRDKQKKNEKEEEENEEEEEEIERIAAAKQLQLHSKYLVYTNSWTAKHQVY